MAVRTRKILLNGQLRDIPIPATQNEDDATNKPTFSVFAYDLVRKYTLVWKVLGAFIALIIVGRYVSVHVSAALLMAMILYLMLTNLAAPRKPGEVSAYSVFNEGYEHLPGQLSAKDFENQMRGMRT